MIAQEIIDRVREATDIVEVISKTTLLKASGKGYKGLCPFHQEKSPSFTVNPEKQFFHCFGCRAGGNVYHFLMRSEGLSFLEAVRELAQRARIALPQAGAAEEPGNESLRRKLLDVNAWAAGRFQQALKSAKVSGPVQAYLKQRAVSPELAERFGLGYAPSGWDNLLRAGQRDHYSEALLESAGLVVPRQGGTGFYDRFRDRLMFPIRDIQGRPVAFGGRLLEPGEPKYLNSSDTEIFHKGELLFGLDLAREAARRQGRLVLVEGYMDVMACHEAGVAEAVATLGTALTVQQARLMRRYAEKVILLYDADEAGVQASLRAFEILKQEKLGLQVVSLPGAKDPDEFIRKFGALAFEKILGQAMEMVAFVLKVSLERGDARSISGKIAIVKQVVPFLALLRNSLAEEAIQRQEYIKILAERLQLEQAQVMAIVDQESRRRPQNPDSREAVRTPPAEDWAARLQSQAGIQTRTEERLLLGTLLRFPAQLETVRDKLDLEFFADPALKSAAQRIFEAVPPDSENEDSWLSHFLSELPDADSAEIVAGLAAGEVMESEDRQAAEQRAGRIIQDCLRRLHGARLRERLDRIQRQIKEADTAGEWEILRRLQQQKIDWERQFKQLGVDWKPAKSVKFH